MPRRVENDRGWLPRPRATACWAVMLSVPLFSPLLQPGEARALTTFASGSPEKRVEVPFDLGEVWYYDRQGNKVLPDIGLEWLTVVFRPEPGTEDPASVAAGSAGTLPDRARALVERTGRLEEPLCDPNLVEEGCFFGLRPGTREQELLPFLLELNQDPAVDYAHPTVVLDGRTFAFFDAAEVRWKTETDPLERERLLAQAFARQDPAGEDVHRVDLFQIPLFKAVNLLAEDIHVREARPVLVEVLPSLRASLTLGMQGGSIGDRIPFAFTVTFSERVQIDPGSIANLSLRPEEVQKELFEMEVDPYDYVKAARVSPIRICGWVKLYAPGDYVIPPVRVRYLCPGCSAPRDRSLLTDSVPVRIASIVPAGAQTASLIVPGVPPRLPDEETLHRAAARRRTVQALLCFLAALLPAGWLVLRARLEARRTAAAAEKSATEVLAEKLEALLAAPPREAQWSFAAAAGGLFRQYLVERFRFPGAAGGSGEIFFRSIRQSLPPGLAPRVQGILQTIDSVVAREMDCWPDLDRFIREIRETLKS